MLSMLLAITTSAAVSTWIFFCLVVYAWHYLIEVVLDLPIIGQSPCAAHASLKLLIQRIIQEAIGLPSLKKAQEHPGAPAEDVNRTYEDLLATAILNKVIQNYQDELPTSSANSVSSRLSNSSRQNDKEYFFGEETLDTKWKNGNMAAADVDTTSVSSLDEWGRSDSSVGSTKYVDHMSLTIQQRIEEVSSSDDEADIEPAPKNIHETEGEEWQENWLMQKRKFGGTASPVPVPMLVPNPTIEAKVLIGDRDAEDTTDLSDAGSDFGDMEPVQSLEGILVDSKTVIGGKNLLIDVNVEEKNISEDGSTDASDIVQEKERVLEQLKSDVKNEDSILISESISETVSVDSTTILEREHEDISPVSLESNTEQDTEYTEKYATLPRTIMKSPTLMLRDLKTVTDSFAQKEETPQEFQPVNGAEIKSDVKEQNGHYISTDEDEQFKEKFKGSYSEREKQKWNNAIEMKNNPYSSENLNRRLSNRSSKGSNASLFGRDYYIKEAAKSAGARKKVTSDQDEVDYQTTKLVQHTTEEASKEHASLPSSLDASVFKAVPAIVDTDSSHQTDNESSIEIVSPTEVASPIRSNLLDMSSDSDLSIERVYNLPSGKVYEKVGDVHHEITARNKSPEGIRYTPTTEFDKNKFVLDENHNTTTSERKRDFLRSLTEINETYSLTTQLKSQISSPTNDDVFSEPFQTPVNQVSNNTNKVPFSPNKIADDQTACDKNVEHIWETTAISNNETQPSSKEFSLEYSTDECDSNTISNQNSLNIPADPEIVDLKDKHLVKERLGLFSKSYPNLAAVPLRKATVKKEQAPNSKSMRYSDEISPASMQMLDQPVLDLRRKFDYENSPSNKQELPKNNPVHSLTARSIPREFRQELKGKETEIHPDIKNNSTTIEENKTDEPKVFPTARSRIQFFENLNR